MKVSIGDAVFEGTFDEYVSWCKYNNVEPKNDNKSEEWAKIGRKVGELKVGDVVKLTKTRFGVPADTVTCVKDVQNNGVLGFGITFDVINNRGINLFLYSDSNGVELVAPVESVVNISV